MILLVLLTNYVFFIILNRIIYIYTYVSRETFSFINIILICNKYKCILFPKQSFSTDVPRGTLIYYIIILLVSLTNNDFFIILYKIICIYTHVSRET